jgi:tetratricopeptide (TPR) repeat protein
MSQLIAQIVLCLWIPVVVIIFLSLPPKRAVIASYVIAWLTLPNLGFNIPGLPNYTKMSATVVGVLFCTLLFDAKRLYSFRPRWYDLPIVGWCFGPFFTALTNDLGAYEGLSSMVEMIVSWGLPYYIGRIYMTDLASIRDLCVGIVIGGLIYCPFCLVEIRMSPVFQGWIYGVDHWEGVRYGGYRPRVFLVNGLELGMWMTNATFLAYQLWVCRGIKMLGGIKFGWLLIGLGLTTLLCKSTGALILLSMGVAAIWLARRTKRSWPVWLLILIPPSYEVCRTFNLWSGRELVSIAKDTVGADRAQSFEYRLEMEDMLVAKALQRPVFGWGRFNRANIISDTGKVLTVQDGFWIIAMGLFGTVGLVSLTSLMILPIIRTISRYPVSTWDDPQIGPVIALSMMMLLTMIDFLSNAMLNPIFALAIGGLVGLPSVRLSGGPAEAVKSLEQGSDLISDGHPLEAAHEFHRAIQFVADGDDVVGREIHARALDGLGHSLAAIGRFEEAEGALRDALMVRDWLAAQVPDAGHFQDLAIAREGLARLLVETNRSAEAVEERRIALKIWDILVADHRRDAGYKRHRVEALNDLAWILATDPDPEVRNPSLALAMAEEAVEEDGDQSACWNTVGVARYRMGDWAGAIEALERSALSSMDGLGTAFDHFFIAMAWGRLQREELARDWFERGVAWTTRHRPGHPTLARFREEAEWVLSTETGPASLGHS